uniref:Uncharacterized protein n=1 Tax=Anopheles farauti TaxID=69004 RepID=A0A1Y9H9I0_9DIPT
MDMEEGDLIDDRSSTDGGYQRRNSLSHSSSDTDSEQEQIDCITPQSSGRRSAQAPNKRDNDRQHEETQQDGDICVGCLAAALNKKQKNVDNAAAQDDPESDSYTTETNGSKSLPATLKKYKGHHSTGSCRGMNPPDHYHPYPHNDYRENRVYHHQQTQQHLANGDDNNSQQPSNVPFKFYKTDRGQARKLRTPLRNLIPQSISAPCDTESSLRVCVRDEPEQHSGEAPSATLAATDSSNNEADQVLEVHPTYAKRRCSLSRNSSCSSSTERKDVVTVEDLKIAIDYSNDEDGSDETEPNSDNDLIIRRSERGDPPKEIRKK